MEQRRVVIGAPVAICTPARAEDLLQTAAAELANDFERVTGIKAALCQGEKPPMACSICFRLDVPGTEEPLLAEPEAYTIRTHRDGDTTFIDIHGADAMACLHGVHRFSELALGIDPWEYFTGKQPPASLSSLPVIDADQPAPAFRYRFFTDDDSDELANFKGEKLHIDLDVWKGVIDSFVRVGYNGLLLIDSLGRGEFWLEDEIFRRHYGEVCPRYEPRPELVEQVINYAHSKGVFVAVYLHWNFPPDTTRLSWPQNRDYYEDNWRRMLTEGPHRLADAYHFWPQGPLLDSTRPVGGKMEWWQVANEQRRLLKQLIAELHPGKPLYYLMWQEWVYDAFLDGRFDIDETDTIVLIPAEARGEYRQAFAELRRRFPHRFGTLYFPGSWEDHLVQDPRPHVIGSALRKAVRWGYTEALINDVGSSLRNFLFNMEAVSRFAWNPEGFDADQFSLQWAERYFGQGAAAEVAAVLRQLHEAHRFLDHDGLGGLALLVERGLWLAWGMLPQGKAHQAAATAQEALRAAKALRDRVASESRLFLDSYVIQQIRLFRDIAVLAEKMIRLEADLRAVAQQGLQSTTRSELRCQAEAIATAATELFRTLESEPMPKWNGWYRRQNLRFIGAPPKLAFFTGLPERIAALESVEDVRHLLEDLHERDRLWQEFRANPSYGRRA